MKRDAMLRGGISRLIFGGGLAISGLSVALMALSMAVAPLLPDEGQIMLWGEISGGILRFAIVDVRLQIQPALADVRAGYSANLSPRGDQVAILNSDEHLQIMDVLSGETRDVNLPRRPNYDYFAVWSPDQTQIVFAVGFPEQGQTLFVTDANGLVQREIAIDSDDVRFAAPQWSPDGRQFAQPITGGLYLFNVYSGELRFLQDEIYRLCCYRWSPDSTQIAFTASFLSENDEVFPPLHILNLATLEIAAIERSDSWRSLAWTLDSQHLLMVTNYGQLNILDVAAQETRQLEDNERGRTYRRAALSPITDEIASYSYRIPIDAGLYVRGLEGTERIRLDVPVTNALTAPEWSPDGQQIAYVSQERDGTKLVVARADGSSVHEIAITGFVEDFTLAWQG